MKQDTDGLMTESETVELKKSLAELKQGLVSLTAMLNKHGQAELWFGIAPDGRAIGLDLNEKTLRDLSQAIAAHVEPAIYPEISQQLVGGKPCLKVKVQGWQTPYFAYGRAYIRVADEDRKLSAVELKSLILQNNREALRWENEPSGLSLDQLVSGKIDRFLDMAKLPWDTTENALEKLDLLREGKPVNAASLFFGLAPIQLRCAVFATQTSSTIIDRHDFDGDVLELLQEAEKYILKNIHIGMRLEGLHRVDVPEISLKAIREALVNAFCHRDWRDPDYVQVAIFRDRLEVRSPGCLYGNLTLDEIRRGNVSRRRNPKIAELLRRVHLVEAWGRGVPLILENAPQTNFVQIGGLFITRFLRSSSGTQPTSGNVLDFGDTSKETSKDKETGGSVFSPTVSSSAREIMLLLKAKPTMTANDLAARVGITVQGVRYHLNQLKKQGKLRRHGATKTGYWEVVGETDQ
ncbi:MAG: ATP-binding protein [Lautropia sp.]|nr:ATP-binding protein [Lautropia sp.]